MKTEVSPIDIENLTLLRKNVTDFLSKCASIYDGDNKMLLDIAPQDHEGASPYFVKSKIKTLDIDNDSKADYIADICTTSNNIINNDFFDMIVCTEVLEHTLNPFLAVNEIYRILKPNGYVFVTVPFNLRIHGPLPDCWRISEHGLKSLFSQWEIVKLEALETKDRFLMPIQYTLIAKKVV